MILGVKFRCILKQMMFGFLAPSSDSTKLRRGAVCVDKGPTCIMDGSTSTLWEGSDAAATGSELKIDLPLL